MKTTSLLALVTLAPSALVPSVLAQSALEDLWVEQITGGVATGGFVAADGAGGVLLFGADSGPIGSPPPAGDELFVARYEMDGTPMWVERFGSSGPEFGTSILADGTGGAFVSGRTQGDFGGPLQGLTDGFVARYDANGNRLWLLQDGSTSTDQFVDLAADGAGGCLALGQTRGNWAGPNPGGSTEDGVLIRYDAGGNQLWATQFGTVDEDSPLSVAADGAGGALVAGWTQGTFPGNAPGDGPSFVARFDPAGTLTSVVQFGPPNESPNAVIPDGSGGAFVASRRANGTTSITIEGTVSRVDSAGNVAWSTSIVTPGPHTLPSAIERDASGTVVVAGTVYDGIIGQGAPGIITPIDGFVGRYDATGSLVSYDMFGGPDSDAVLSLALEGAAGIWLGGNTTGAFGGPSHSGYQLFAARLGLRVGASYCGPAVANSTGVPGRIVAAGSRAASDGAMTLVARDLPPQTFGYFLTSRTTGLVPMAGGSQGTLCLGGAVGRYNRAGEIGATGADGTFPLALDLTSTPQPTGTVPILAGQTWNFQAWYRDANPQVTSNFTDGVAVAFL
ncbi:MAG: hypothetical protein AAF726_22480 [Planctomycetota bacterium]